MKIWVITDIHNNIDALNAVLDEFSSLGVEKDVCSGEHCASQEIIGYHRDQPMTKEEQKKYFTKCYKNITIDIVVLYFKYCNDGVNMSNKKGLHILELLFLND